MAAAGGLDRKGVLPNDPARDDARRQLAGRVADGRHRNGCRPRCPRDRDQGAAAGVPAQGARRRAHPLQRARVGPGDDEPVCERHVADQEQGVAQMRLALVLLSLLVPFAAGAQTPAGALERGLAAEGAGRFETALAIYLEVLGREPQRTDLWVRVADIHARLGRQQEGIGALARAAAASPRDGAIHVRLSEAYAEVGNADAALAAIEVAAALAPDSADLLRRRATLATWRGAYGRAQDSYRGLLRLDPGDADAMLGLARTSAWAGDTDRAVAMYRKYLAVRSTNPEVWIELARAEGWRGNFAASWDVLDQYRGL